MIPVKVLLMHPIKNDQKGIEGGFYLKARKIESSQVAHSAPVIREVWDWLLRQCNHKDNPTLGIKRGQCIRKLSDMQEGLHWYVGYRKMTYSKSQCEGACEALRKMLMITTAKTTRGMVITICNYNTYQTISNYEDNSEGNKNPTRTQQPADTINKNDKECNKNSTPPVHLFSHNGFFDRQLAENTGEPEFDNYRVLVEYLHGKNEDELRFKNVLSLEKQISYHDFVRLKAAAKESGRTIKEVLTAMENRATLSKDYKNVYLTAKKWLTQEFKK